MSTDTPSPRVFQKGYLPPEITRGDTNISFHINKFPLGDIDNFSVARASYGLGQQRAGRGTLDRYAPWEAKYLQAIAEVKANQGEQVSGIDGGFLAPEYWGSKLFGLLRSFSALDQLPITRMTVPARLGHIPKVSGDITVAYPGEMGALTSTTYQLGEVSYTPRKATALLNIPNELMRDAPGTVDQLLQGQGAEAIAQDRDKQAFVGTGTGGTPLGLLNLPQVPVFYPNTVVSGAISTTPASFTPSYQQVAQLIAKVEILNSNANVTAGQALCDGIVAHSRIKQTVWSSARFQDSSARPITSSDLNSGGGLFGAKWALTNVIPTNSTLGGGTTESFFIAGWWRKFVLFECLTLGFDATTEAQGMANDQTQVRLVHRFDCGPIAPEAFAILAGCLV